MRLLIVIGAGASFDCWTPEHPNIKEIKIPLAKDLFSLIDPQEKLLNHYKLMGLADEIKEVLDRSGKDSIDLEKELETINDRALVRKDEDMLLALFNARFYLQNLIYDLRTRTLELTQERTAYVTLLRKLKDWIYEQPGERNVEIVTFNYDDLLEEAMNHVYLKTWSTKTGADPLEGYYKGKFLRIYRPHGSIAWGRRIDSYPTYYYDEAKQLVKRFGRFKLSNEFVPADPTWFSPGSGKSKDFVPAVAIPFKTKDTFDECPPAMQKQMEKTVENADILITIGWKGADDNLVSLLKKNKKIKSVYIVSPSGDTELSHLPKHSYNIGFSDFVYNVKPTQSLDHFLKAI